ncbi:MAG TPA: lipopolysaccharide biosynthesis protein [Hyphomonadaceae bacterium]|nr:lipopolysaccharide biosynthesis protein [Hyphomonadaceae bacterium]
MIWRRLLGYFPANLAGGLASFGGVYALTRLLSSTDYGFYSLALTIMGGIYTLTITWAEAAAYRFAGEAAATNTMPDHIRTVMRLLAVSAALGIGLMLGAIAITVSPALRLALAAATATMVLAPLINSAQEMSRAQQRVARYSVVRMTQDIGAFLLGTLFAWRTGLGAAAPFAGLASVLAVLAVAEGARLWRESRGGVFRHDRVKRYFAYGVPVAFALALNIALDTGDRLLIALFLGPDSVGVYAAGYGIADKSVGLLCAWAAAAGAPMMMAAWEREGPEAVRAVSAHVARTLMLIAAPAATGLALVAHPLSEVMIGEEMRTQAATIMPWIALSGLINGFVLHYLSEAFQLSRRTDLRAGLMVIPAVANIVLNVILLPRIGLMGAVYATVASYALALVLLAAAGRKLAPLAWPWLDFARVAGSCAAMAIVVRLLPAPGGPAELVLKAGAGAVTYAAAALAFDAGGARAALREFLARRVRQA